MFGICFSAWLGFSFLVARFGETKTIGYGNALLVSLLCSPVIGFIVVWQSTDIKRIPDEVFPHKMLIAEAEQAEFYGEPEKAMKLYLAAIAQLKQYDFKTPEYQQQRQQRIAELEERIVFLRDILLDAEE